MTYRDEMERQLNPRPQTKNEFLKRLLASDHDGMRFLIEDLKSKGDVYHESIAAILESQFGSSWQLYWFERALNDGDIDEANLLLKTYLPVASTPFVQRLSQLVTASLGKWRIELTNGRHGRPPTVPYMTIGRKLRTMSLSGGKQESHIRELMKEFNVSRNSVLEAKSRFAEWEAQQNDVG